MELQTKIYSCNIRLKGKRNTTIYNLSLLQILDHRKQYPGEFFGFGVVPIKSLVIKNRFVSQYIENSDTLENRTSRDDVKFLRYGAIILPLFVLIPQSRKKAAQFLISFVFMRSLRIPFAVEPFDYISQKGARVIFDDTHYVDNVQYSNYLKDKKDFIISLVLLKESPVDFVEFKFDNLCVICETPKQKSKLGCRRDRSVSQLFDLKSNLIRIEINSQDIGNILRYFLTSYRDGIADIDHIDVDFDNPEFCITLTFMFVPCGS